MEIKKNSHYETEIIDMSKNGEGIGKIDGFTVFVDGTVVGDTAEVLMMKVKKTYGYGKLIKIIKPSENRIEPQCKYFSKCGGCSLLHTDYAHQAKIKQNIVKSDLLRIGGINFDVPLPLTMETPFRYRNKAQMPVGTDKEGNPQIGFYSKYSHRIIDIDDCLIQNESVAEIAKKIKSFITKTNITVYNEENHSGVLRHVLIRTGYVTGEIIVMLVINANSLPFADVLVDELKTIKNLVGITININREKTNAVTGTKLKTLWGKGTITDYIDNLKFEISPLSFFQVNPQQTKLLYGTALDFADLENGTQTVFDAYCGTGTISLFLAQKAKKVYGIEIVPQAIENANKNAQLNNITNAEFIVGKSEEEIPRLFSDGIKADVVVVDPPRKGCDEKLLVVLEQMKPNKIVYISCDSATLARDLKHLTSNGYTLKKIQPVDMFCHSLHIETVALLERDI